MLLTLAACGGGAGGISSAGGTSAIGIPNGSATAAATVIPSASPTTPPGVTVSGTVVALPADAYGPAAIAGVTYASADASQTAPLADATVIVGPVPITGATPPAQLPTGDVAVMTTANGGFALTPATAPAAASSAEPFVVPPDNLSGFAPPATGYYVEVFGAGTDGKSAGAPFPLHRFVGASTSLVLRVSSASAAEAGALTAVNADRAANGAGPLIFDESAEEAARLHANDESSAGYTCHYDTKNVGPSSRYLAAGAIGLTGENLALVSGTGSVAFGYTEAAFLAEKTATPPGGHYLNLVDSAHVWAGLAAVVDESAPAFANVDYELVTPSAADTVVSAYGYGISAPCPTGTVVNNS
jgi:uncharacterized protein YkwD